MKVLFIGGTGTISMAITKRLLEEGHKVYLLNRGTRNGELPAGAIGLTGDIEDEEQICKLTEHLCRSMWSVTTGCLREGPDSIFLSAPRLRTRNRLLITG